VNPGHVRISGPNLQPLVPLAEDERLLAEEHLVDQLGRVTRLGAEVSQRTVRDRADRLADRRIGQEVDLERRIGSGRGLAQVLDRVGDIGAADEAASVAFLDRDLPHGGAWIRCMDGLQGVDAADEPIGRIHAAPSVEAPNWRR